MNIQHSSGLLKSKPTLSTLSLSVATALLVTGCGSDSDNNGVFYEPETSPLIDKAVVVKDFKANELMTFLEQQAPIAYDMTETPKCDIQVQKFAYNTKGVQDEAATATAAMMIPVGDDPACQGDRPILLYTHGTAVEKSYDFSQVANANNEAGTRSAVIAANYAAQGYIVIASNYAGYDESTLDYHPYLNARQQSMDVYDALQAGRAALDQQSENSKVADSGKLFISGYSQGGYVSMAAARHLQDMGETVTAIAPMSGSYAMAAFGDAMMAGNINQGGTVFIPMIARNYQKDYGNLYSSTSELFAGKYANTAETAIPSDLKWGEVLSSGKIPLTQVFQSNTGNAMLDALSPPSPMFAYGFDDTDYLINTNYRLNYLADAQANPDGINTGSGLPADNPQHPLRKALKENDFRNYVPNMPVFLCGGNQDPMVFFDLNTTTMGAILSQKANAGMTDLDVTIMDVDITNADSRQDKTELMFIGKAAQNKRNMESVAKSVQTKFAKDLQTIAQTTAAQVIANGGTAAEAAEKGQIAVFMDYHSALTAPSCISATRQYFSQF